MLIVVKLLKNCGTLHDFAFHPCAWAMLWIIKKFIMNKFLFVLNILIRTIVHNKIVNTLECSSTKFGMFLNHS